MMEQKFKPSSMSTHVRQSYPSNLSLNVKSAPKVRNLFTHACPEWKEGTYELFKDWAVKQFSDPRSEDEGEGDVPVEYKKMKDILFERNGSGGLIIPPMSEYVKSRELPMLMQELYIVSRCILSSWLMF